mmetsp:Transcript_39128/g.123367  ORF Transcript_39128/g.123367 Transcript_39128/m.123367 type:complete len:126 (+) Transcript_39128:363-740(+)
MSWMKRKKGFVSRLKNYFKQRSTLKSSSKNYRIKSIMSATGKSKLLSLLVMSAYWNVIQKMSRRSAHRESGPTIPFVHCNHQSCSQDRFKEDINFRETIPDQLLSTWRILNDEKDVMQGIQEESR